MRKYAQDTVKKYQIIKRLAMMDYMNTGLKKSLSFMRLAIEVNRYLHVTDITEWMRKEKIILIQKDPHKWNRSQQL